MARDEKPRPIGDSLDSLMRSLRGPGRREIGGLFGGWDDAVGPAVAAHVRPVRLDDAVLTVEVDDPAWATQVRVLHRDLIQRIADATGVELDGINVTVAGRRRRR